MLKTGTKKPEKSVNFSPVWETLRRLLLVRRILEPVFAVDLEVVHPFVLHLAEDELRRADHLDLHFLPRAHLARGREVKIVPGVFPDEGLENDSARIATASALQADSLPIHKEDERFARIDEEPLFLDENHPNQKDIIGPWFLDLPDFQEELFDVQEARVVNIHEGRDARRLRAAFEFILDDSRRLVLRSERREAGGAEQHCDEQFFEHGLSLSEWTL